VPTRGIVVAPPDGVKLTNTRSRVALAVAVDFTDQEDTPVARVAVPTSGVPLDAFERALIAFALRSSEGNRTRAARFLGLSRSALIYRMHKHGLVTGL
jgi:DNA-binding NtrC family response regulator